MNDWKFVVPIGLPLEDYAPMVVVIGERWFYTAFQAKAMFTTDDPVGGQWTKVADMGGYSDPGMLVDHDGKVYMYSGCSNNGVIKVRAAAISVELCHDWVNFFLLACHGFVPGVSFWPHVPTPLFADKTFIEQRCLGHLLVMLQMWTMHVGGGTRPIDVEGSGPASDGGHSGLAPPWVRGRGRQQRAQLHAICRGRVDEHHWREVRKSHLITLPSTVLSCFPPF
jgi:hypothetical protein